MTIEQINCCLHSERDTSETENIIITNLLCDTGCCYCISYTLDARVFFKLNFY